MDNHRSFAATDRSYLALLKREIHSMANQLEFPTHRLAEIDLIVAELASNLIKHATGGEILVRSFNEANQSGIELISIDQGPGIADPTRMLEDGMSTTQTLGHGLGSIKRLSDTFQIYSQLDWGTIILSRIYKVVPSRRVSRLDIRSIVVPKPGETQSGDGFFAKIAPEQVKLFLGDGLGHGPEAALAVQTAIEALKTSTEARPSELIRLLHRAVKKTRGLVGTLAFFDARTRTWQLCGVGNISTTLKGANFSKRHFSYNGIIGMNIPTSLNEQTLVMEAGQYLILCSDGIRSRWETYKYPNITKYDLSILAAALYKDYARKTDDMSIVVCRFN